MISEIKTRYEGWHRDSLAITGSTRADTDALVDLLNQYKSFIDVPNYRKKFKSQSKLHSSVIEEFMYYLFRRIPGLEPGMTLGNMQAYTNLYFAPASLTAMGNDCGMSIYTKNQDFAIAKVAELSATPSGQTEGKKKGVCIPVVSVECKTYIDKTMYEGAVATAERIKQGNPYSRFIVVAEFYDVSVNVDPKQSKIDQIYVLRRQTSHDGKNALNPIDKGVVWQLFSDIRKHLGSKWSNMSGRLAEGLMI
jgi:hypothetical protein